MDIADLLRRREIVGLARGWAYLTDQTVMVTGAGGSIGLELCMQVARAGPGRIVLLGHGENSLFEAQLRLREAFPSVVLHLVVADIRDPRRLDRVFRRLAPRIVFHAAACKHVPLMEENFEEAISTNVVGTANVVDAALGAGVERLVAISTDKAVSPAGIMGASKRLAGTLVRDAGRRTGRAFLVVRFGNVLDSRGGVVSVFERQIRAGGPLTITHPGMTRFFMTVSEAVHLVLAAGGIGRGGELYVLDMGRPVRIVDLARDLIRRSGLTAEQMPIVFTGVRPGEKLEESLWERGALVEGTGQDHVLRVRESESAGDNLRAAVRALQRAARAGDRASAVAILHERIPTFSPGAGQVTLAGGQVSQSV